jgi:hypothetical protein
VEFRCTEILNWRNIAIALIDPIPGEQTAHACANTGFNTYLQVSLVARAKMSYHCAADAPRPISFPDWPARQQLGDLFMTEIKFAAYDLDTPSGRQSVLKRMPPDRETVAKYHAELLDLFKREMEFRREMGETVDGEHRAEMTRSPTTSSSTGVGCCCI